LQRVTYVAYLNQGIADKVKFVFCAVLATTSVGVGCKIAQETRCKHFGV